MSFLVKTFLLQAFYIPSESMEQTLLRGDRVIVNKIGANKVNRGDIVVFTDPGRWLGGHSGADRKSTRLNSSHVAISYAVFCLKKNNNHNIQVVKRMTTIFSYTNHR